MVPTFGDNDIICKIVFIADEPFVVGSTDFSFLANCIEHTTVMTTENFVDVFHVPVNKPAWIMYPVGW